MCEPRRSSPSSDWFPEMLLPLLVPLLWLWSRTGAAPPGTGPGTEQLDSVVSFTPTLSGEVLSRTDGMMGNHPHPGSDVKYQSFGLEEQRRARCAFTMMMNEARTEPRPDLIGSDWSHVGTLTHVEV